MYITRNILLLVFITLLSSCKENNSKAQVNSESLDPVETRSPNTDFEPAFKEQTRAPGMQTETDLQIDILAESIGRPWGITHLPDGRLLITDKSGFMQIFNTDGTLVNKITGFPEVDTDAQGGLLDVTLDPEFNTNRLLYWTFSEPYQEGNLTSVAKGRLADDEKAIENPEVIFRAEPAYPGILHYGSRILFDKDGYLFVSTGERSDKETRMQAQNLNSGMGKILRMTSDGSPAPNNPFISNPKAVPQIYSYGHRNVQGLSLHPETGELWAGEFGPRGGDEINLIKPGNNYGWPIITYGLEYSGEAVGEGIAQKEGLEQPNYYWDPSISFSGITFYNGEISEWKNDLFLACLAGNHIARIKLEGDKVVGEERLLDNEGERFRDVHQGKDGKLYAITDSGKIYKIGKKK
ncbi:MAG TPA: PQQ-dependent sugar dehydrogenase [Flavobacteriaceae bacterium]|nr:PQQ-dependent sugar dehydrogenase [Flavobacteriaceae bacterium]